MSKRRAAAKRGAATKAVQREIAAQIAAKKDEELAAVLSTPRSKKAARKVEKQRIANLERDGLTRKQAKEVVRRSNQDSSNGLQVGMLVQYYSDGLRAGYIADMQAGSSQVKIQPIGPRGSELPTQLFIKLTDVLIPEAQHTKGENEMSSIIAKSKELKDHTEKKVAEKAAKLIENLKKAHPVAAKEATKTDKTKTVKAEKTTAKAVKTAKKEAAPKAEKKAAGEKRAVAEQTWKFAKVGPATGQRAVILEVLQSLGGTATRTKLAAALTKKLDSSQDANTVLSLKKKFLIDNGCVKVS